MSDQPTDRNRPPKYGGPRNQTRNSPDAPHHDRGDWPQPLRDDQSEPRNRPSSHSRDRPHRPPDRERRDSPSKRYGEAYQRQRTRTLSERHPASDPREPRPPERTPPFEWAVDEEFLEAFEALEFESDAQKRVYRYVERQGLASAAEVRSHVDLPEDHLSEAIRRLEQKDYLDARDGTLRVAHNTDIEREYAVGGVDVTIRPARQEDLADLVALIRTVTDERTYVVAESVAAQLSYEETVIRHTDVHSRMFFVATVGDDGRGDPEVSPDSRIVGWAHLTLPELEHLDHTAELTVGVRDDFRRRGIGSHLMGVAFAWAATNDYHRIYQSLPGTNRAAIDFLRAHGWTTEAVLPDHYRIDGEFVDEVTMAVTLDA